MNHITILMATYQGQAYLREQLDSILHQTEPNWKLIISDDQSADDTRKIISEYTKRYPDRISEFVSGKKFGHPAAHFLFLVSEFAGQAEYLMLSDQDDVWLPNKIEKTLCFMKRLEQAPKDKEPVLVFSDLKVVDSELGSKAPSFLRSAGLDGNRTELRHLMLQNVVTGSTMMLNRALQQKIGHQYDADKIVMHDWWIGLVASAFGKIGFIDEPLVLYRQHTDNAVGAGSKRHALDTVRNMNHPEKVLVKQNAGFAQAGCFLKYYGEELSPKDKSMIQTYARFSEAGRWERIAALFRWGMWKKGWKKKLGQIIYLWMNEELQ